MTAHWAPILGPAERARAAEVLDAIAEALREPPPPYGGRLSDDALAVSLFGREPGFAIFHSYFARATGRGEHEELARGFLETAVSRLALARDRPYFAFGFVGLAWALQHLDQWIVEIDDDELDELDTAIATHVERSSDFALPKGLVGYAIYALERMPRRSARAILERAVARLIDLADRSTAGLAWRLPPERTLPHLEKRFPDGMLVLGVLDGTAGVLAALAAAARAGARSDRADATIADAARWLDAQRAAAGESPLPAAVGDKPSRPSWGYGEVGIAAALVATAHPACRELGLELGRIAARRTDDEGVDASLVRGAAGVAHAFNRLFQHTGDELFGTAARRWFDITLAAYRPGAGLGGYRFWGDAWMKDYIPELDVGWIDQPGVFDGIAGVGLALLAAATPVEPAWDRAILLSTKPE